VPTGGYLATAPKALPGAELAVSWDTLALLMPLDSYAGDKTGDETSEHRVRMADVSVRYPEQEEVQKLLLDIANEPDKTLNTYGLSVVVHSVKDASEDELKMKSASQLLPSGGKCPAKVVCHIQLDDARGLVEAMEKPSEDNVPTEARPEGIDDNNALHLVCWALLLMDTIDPKERWGRAKRWGSPDCELTGYDELTKEQVYHETHLAISRNSTVCVSPVEATARLVAICCAFSGQSSQFGFGKLGKKANARILKNAQVNVRERKSGAVIFAQDCGLGNGEQRLYSPEELALVKGVGLMRQTNLERAKTMTASEKFSSFACIYSADSTYGNPWSSDKTPRDYFRWIVDRGIEIFWQDEINKPSSFKEIAAQTKQNKQGLTFLGMLGLLRNASLRLAEHDVRSLGTVQERLRYVAVNAPSSMVGSYLGKRVDKWMNPGFMKSMNATSHSQEALVALVVTYSFGYHSFGRTTIARAITEWQKREVGHAASRWAEWLSNKDRAIHNLKRRGMSPDVRQKVEDLDMTSKRQAGMVEYLNFAKWLNDMFLMPMLAIMDVMVEGEKKWKRCQWLDYAIAAALFHDLSSLYDGEAATGHVTNIAHYWYYLCALAEDDKLKIYLDEEHLEKSGTRYKSSSNVGSMYFPGASITDFRILVKQTEGAFETSDDEPYDLCEIVRETPEWLVPDDSSDHIHKWKIAMGEEWTSVEYDEEAFVDHAEEAWMGSRKKATTPPDEGVAGKTDKEEGNNDTTTVEKPDDDEGRNDDDKSGGKVIVGEAPSKDEGADNNEAAEKLNNEEASFHTAATSGFEGGPKDDSAVAPAAGVTPPTVHGGNSQEEGVARALQFGETDNLSKASDAGETLARQMDDGSIDGGGGASGESSDEDSVVSWKKRTDNKGYSHEDAVISWWAAVNGGSREERLEATFKLNHFYTRELKGEFEYGPDGCRKLRTCCLHPPVGERKCTATGKPMDHCVYCKSPIHMHPTPGCASVSCEADTRFPCCPPDSDDCPAISRKWQEERKAGIVVNNIWPVPHPRLHEEYPEYVTAICTFNGNDTSSSSGSSGSSKNNNRKRKASDEPKKNPKNGLPDFVWVESSDSSVSSSHSAGSSKRKAESMAEKHPKKSRSGTETDENNIKLPDKEGEEDNGLLANENTEISKDKPRLEEELQVGGGSRQDNVDDDPNNNMLPAKEGEEDEELQVGGGSRQDNVDDDPNNNMLPTKEGEEDKGQAGGGGHPELEIESGDRADDGLVDDGQRKEAESEDPLEPDNIVALGGDGHPTAAELANHPDEYWSPERGVWIRNGFDEDGNPTEEEKAKHPGKYYDRGMDMWKNNPKPKKKLPDTIDLEEEELLLVTTLREKLGSSEGNALFACLGVAFKQKSVVECCGVLTNILRKDAETKMEREREVNDGGDSTEPEDEYDDDAEEHYESGGGGDEDEPSVGEDDDGDEEEYESGSEREEDDASGGEDHDGVEEEYESGSSVH